VTGSYLFGIVGLLGLALAMLSMTGVLIWWRKRGGRMSAAAAKPRAPEGRLALPGPAVEPVPALSRTSRAFR